MSIFNSLRHAFGFDSDDDSYIDDEPIADSNPESDDTQAGSTVTSATPQQVDEEPAITADTIAQEMMASVVELFNSFQPEFIARCLDPEKQKSMIAQHLSPTLLAKIEEIASAERARIAREAAEERADLDADLRRMRERNDELEKRRMLFKDEQLSATRQKRALQERIHDLEVQTEQLEAEKEQLELENRSMSNKLRAASVGGMNLAPDLINTDDKTQQKLEDLGKKVEELESENAALSQKLKEADDRHVSDTGSITSLTEELNQARSLMKQANAHEEELNELRQQVEDLQEIAAQTEKIVELAEKKEARIAELKIRLKDAENAFENVDRLMKENKSLRSSLESNRYEYALEMSKLRSEIEEMKRAKPRRGRPRKVWAKEENPDDQESNESNQKKKQPHISAIDELIEGSEWLVAPTPEEVRSQLVEEPSDDFGYKAPPRKNTTIDDSNQLTLF